MILILPNLLSASEVASIREALAHASWVAGRETASGAAARVKSNLQLADADPLRAELAQRVLTALVQSAEFKAAALPLRIYPPGFNRYPEGAAYGDHVDGPIRSFPGTTGVVRADLSATLFLSDPDEYEGGELVVRDPSTAHTAKLPAGHLFLYPAGLLHSVRPVTRGERLASFFWVQSLVRDHEERAVLMDLNQIAQRMIAGEPTDNDGLQLVALHHGLLRRWSDA